MLNLVDNLYMVHWLINFIAQSVPEIYWRHMASWNLITIDIGTAELTILTNRGQLNQHRIWDMGKWSRPDITVGYNDSCPNYKSVFKSHMK